MRHWHPYIRDVLARIARDGFSRVVAIPLAPHYSRLSIGAYQEALEQGRGPLEVAFGVPRLHICHLAGVSGRNPLRKIFELVELTNRSNASQVETGVVGRFLHDVRDLRDCRHGIVEVHYDLPCR